MGIYHDVFGCNVMVAVPVQVFICMCRFSLWLNVKDSVVVSVSRNGMDLCGHVSSTVNCMAGPIELMCSKNFSL